MENSVRDKKETVMPPPKEVGTHEVNQGLVLALINALDEKVGLLIKAQQDGVKTAMDAAEKAVAKAESAADKRFEALNELRGMASDWRTEFARQSTVDLQVRALNEKLDSHLTQLNSMALQIQAISSRGSGRADFWIWLTGGIVAGATLFSAFSSHFGHN